MYFGDFTSKQDICDQFRIQDFEGTVILAAYEIDGYEGSAEVIFVQGGKFYMVQGGHCSCYGLEDQWEPVEMPVGGLRRIVEQGRGLLNRYEQGLSGALEMLETLNLEGQSEDVINVALKLAFS